MTTEPEVSAIEVLESTPGTLRALLGSLPESATTQAGPEGWSPRDVLAHLISVQPPALVERIRLMVENDDPPVPNVDEDAVLASSGLRDRPVSELLDRFERERRDAMTWLKGLPPEAFAKGGQHSVAGRITAADQLNHFAYHDLAHTRQIVSLLIPRLERSRGAMSEFFPDSG
jgi:DinB superfamily